MGSSFQLDEIVTPVQPYAARKRYACPGCNGFIEVGIFHLVVIPESAPDLQKALASRLLVQRAAKAPAPPALTISGDLGYPANVDTRPPDGDRYEVDPGDSEPVGQEANLIGLILCEGKGRVIKTAGLNRLHFHSHPLTAEGDHEVDFTTPDPHVAVNDPSSPAFQEIRGEGFAGGSQLLWS